MDQSESLDNSQEHDAEPTPTPAAGHTDKSAGTDDSSQPEQPDRPDRPNRIVLVSSPEGAQELQVATLTARKAAAKKNGATERYALHRRIYNENLHFAYRRFGIYKCAVEMQVQQGSQLYYKVNLNLRDTPHISAEGIVPAAETKLPKPFGGSLASAEQLPELQPGQNILVQLTQRQHDRTPLLRLTRWVSLPGRHLRLIPQIQGRSNIDTSLKPQGTEASLLDQLNIPDQVSVFIHKSAQGVALAALQQDLDSLYQLWLEIQQQQEQLKGPGLIWQADDLISRSVVQHTSNHQKSTLIVADSQSGYDRIARELSEIQPQEAPELKLHQVPEQTPLIRYYFDLYGIDADKDSAAKQAAKDGEAVARSATKQARSAEASPEKTSAKDSGRDSKAAPSASEAESEPAPNSSTTKAEDVASKQRTSSRNDKSQKVLINACVPGEIRVAVTRGSRLRLYSQERNDIPEYRNSIFKGRITARKASLNACFVSIGLPKDGFMQMEEPSASLPAPQEGEEVLVQLVHEQRGTNKGPLVRRIIRMPGKYLLFLPLNPGAREIPAHLKGKAAKQQYLDIYSRLKINPDIGVSLRTQARNAAVDVIQNELEALEKTWENLQLEANACSAPKLMLLDGNLISRTIRDHFTANTSKVVVDSPVHYEHALQTIQELIPEYVHKLELYESPVPLFEKYGLEQQLKQAQQRSIMLPSGAEIVIDRTEAMTTVDVNSRSAGSQGTFSETALAINLESAEEVARQLQLRDLGGLIVIDFIDMQEAEHCRKLEERADELFRSDAAHILRTDISPMGLMEISRQRVGLELSHVNTLPCRHCDGRGWLLDDYSFSLEILRNAQSSAQQTSRNTVRIEAPLRIANFLHNDMRQIVRGIEDAAGVKIHVLAHPYREPPFFEIKTCDTPDLLDDQQYYAPDWQLDPQLLQKRLLDKRNQQKPVMVPSRPKVIRSRVGSKSAKSRSPGLLKRLWNSLFPQKPTHKAHERHGRPQGNKGRRSRQGGNRGRSGQHQNRYGNRQRQQNNR
ncbi:MAG: ribonuclease E/G [Gammaproteobacteria bacterium]